MKLREPTEFDLLDFFVQEMESRGESLKTSCLDIDESMANAIESKINSIVTLEQIRGVADKCLAHEWLKNTVISEKYESLSITQAGVEKVLAKRHDNEVLESRPLLKKFSDYIVDHKGLFILLGFLIAIAGLLIKLKI